MKKNILIIATMVTTVLVGLSSCTRDYTLKSTVHTTDGNSYLRIIDASPNFRSIYNLPDSFNVLINGNKVTGFTPGGTLLMTFGSTFPTVSSGYGYITIPAGLEQIKLSVGGVLTPDSIPITNFTKIFLADKYYTLMITDSIKSIRDSSQILVQDAYTKPTPSFYNLRFIHAVWNDSTGQNGLIDVYSTRNNRNIFNSVKPGTVSSFTQYPYNPLLSDTLIVRRTNSLIPLDTLVSGFSNQRTYTLYYRGDGTTNYNTNTKRRHMATYVHQ